MLALLLCVLLVASPVSPTSHLVRDIRVANGHAIATSQVLNHVAAPRAGVPNHLGLGAACPPVIDGRRVTLCGEVKGWTTISNLHAAVDWVVPAWMASPPHHNLLHDSHWRWVGVAVRRIGGYTWMVAVFAR
jgi:hypothetical protein